MIHAAGVLFLTPDKKALFLQRSNTGDYGGFWALPGGKQEGNETLEECARREAVEECGEGIPAGNLTPWTRAIAKTGIGSGGEPAGDVDFSTFIMRVKEQFTPTLDAESTGYAWAPISAAPAPLHPGCTIALSRIGMDELGVARAMAAGELTSPQRYMNVTLFAIRITGTGVSYRRALDEFVWRNPEHYLNDEFLARCNGLPVIFEHPKKATLNSEEFADRIIGTVLLPYIQGDEVWAIAKLYDDAAIAVMTERPSSTSPSVVLGSPDDTKLKMEDGSVLLIEGKPTLLDHIAMLPTNPDGSGGRGVWDKGGPPMGVALADADHPNFVMPPWPTRNNTKLDAALNKSKHIILDGAMSRLRIHH